jgi:hypothetical protein
MSREKAVVSRENVLKGDNVSRGTPLVTLRNRNKSAPQIRTHLVLGGKRCYGSKQRGDRTNNIINIKIDMICPDGLGKILGTLARVTRRVLDHN